MKRIAKAGMAVGILFGSALVAYAITSLLFTQSQTSSFQKKTIFRFNLSTGLTSGEIGPGDSFSTSPLIYNDATEDMYVFIKVEMPTVVSGEKLYAFDLNSSWVEVEDGVYAYGSENMTTLAPGESTTALTEQMTMKSITNAEYAGIGDINITITGYAIGTEDVGTNPQDAWTYCKGLAGI